MSAGIQAKNLAQIAAPGLPSHELMDIEHEGNLMMITGGLGGTSLLNVEDPRNPEVLSGIFASSFLYGRAYKWDIQGNIAVGTGRNFGMIILDISNTSSPGIITTFDPPEDDLPVRNQDSQSEISLEDVEIVNNTAIFAARADGILFYDISDRENPKFSHQILTRNAWSLAVHNDALYVADSNEGIFVVDISGIIGADTYQDPGIVDLEEAAGTPKDVKYINGHLVVASGAAGLHVYQASNPLNITFSENHATAGFASRVGVFEDLVSVSAWSEIEIFQWQGSSLEKVGYKNTGGRVMATAVPAADVVYSAEWSRLRVYEYGEISGPDLDFSTRVIEFPRLEVGESDTAYATIYNNGNSELEFISVGSNEDEFTVTNPPSFLGAGDSISLEIVYDVQSSSARGQVNFVTNDQDEDVTSIRVNGNSSGSIQVGVPAPNFTLPVIANEQDATLELEELRSDVVIVVFFASW